MRLRNSIQALVALVGVTSLTVNASQPQQHHYDPRDKFLTTLRRVAASAEERMAFSSISIAAPSGQKRRGTAAGLPGADLCTIASTTEQNSLRVYSTYECTWKYANLSEATRTYNHLEEEILLSGDWVARPDRKSHSLRHAAYDASSGALVHLAIRLESAGVVTLVLGRGRTPPESEAPSAPRRSTEGPRPSSDVVAGENNQMNVGMLAIVTEREGVLFIDDEQKEKVSPGKIITLRLTAGQHFADLRDSVGRKLWQQIINVPKGEQVAVRIETAIDNSYPNGGSALGTAPAASYSADSNLRQLDGVTTGVRSSWVNSMTAGLKLAANAASEPIPFESLKVSLDSAGKWTGKTLFSGAEHCYINGPSPEKNFSSYICNWKHSSQTDALQFYSDWLRVIDRDGVWIQDTVPFDKDRIRGEWFHASGTPQVNLFLALWRFNAVSVGIAVRSSESKIESEPSGTVRLKGPNGTLEGYVRDKTGHPIHDCEVSIETGAYSDKKLAFIEFLTPATVIGDTKIIEPSNPLGENFHSTYTDKQGYFKIKAPAGRYFLKVRGPLAKGFSTDKFIRSWIYAAHATGRVDLHANQTVTQDVVLQCDVTFPGKRDSLCQAQQ